MNVARRWTPSFLTGLLLTILVALSTNTGSHAVPIGMGDAYDTEFGEMMQQMQTKRALIQQVEAEGYIPIDRNSRDIYDYGTQEIVKGEDSVETGPTSGRKREVEGPYRHVGIGLAQAEELFNEGAEPEEEPTTAAPGAPEVDGETVQRFVRVDPPEVYEPEGPEVTTDSTTTEATAQEVDGDTAGDAAVRQARDNDEEEPATTATPTPYTGATITVTGIHPVARGRCKGAGCHGFMKVNETGQRQSRTVLPGAGDLTSLNPDDAEFAPEADARPVNSNLPPLTLNQSSIILEEADQREPRTVETYAEKRSQPESDLHLDAAASGFASTEAPQDDDARSVRSFTPPPASIQDAASDEADHRQPRYVDTVAAKRGYQPIPNDFAFGKVLNASTGDSLEDKRLRAIRNPVYVDGDKPKDYPDDKAAHGCNCDHDPKPTTTTTTEASAVTIQHVPAFADEDIIDEEDSSEEPVNVPTVRAKRSWYYFPSRG